MTAGGCPFLCPAFKASLSSFETGRSRPVVLAQRRRADSPRCETGAAKRLTSMTATSAARFSLSKRHRSCAACWSKVCLTLREEPSPSNCYPISSSTLCFKKREREFFGHMLQRRWTITRILVSNLSPSSSIYILGNPSSFPSRTRPPTPILSGVMRWRHCLQASAGFSWLPLCKRLLAVRLYIIYRCQQALPITGTGGPDTGSPVPVPVPVRQSSCLHNIRIGRRARVQNWPAGSGVHLKLQNLVFRIRNWPRALGAASFRVGGTGGSAFGMASRVACRSAQP
jgi:hypothetical protein